MIRVVLVSDVRLYREGLRDMLKRDGRLDVVGTASNIPQTLSRTEDLRPDAVLLDMGITNSLESIRSVLRIHDRTRVISLGVSERREDVIACAEAGAAGYVSRQGTIEDLVASVVNAMHDELTCSAKIAGALLKQVARLAGRQPRQIEFSLTHREAEVASHLDQGLSNKQIAKRLNIEVATVKVHVHNILDKLGVSTRGEATARLRRLGLLQPPRSFADEDSSRDPRTATSSHSRR